MASPQVARSGRVTPDQQRLLRLIRAIDFGFIEGLHVAAGQPAFDPEPRVVQGVKFGSEFRLGAARRSSNLTPEDQQLLAMLAAIGDGVVECLEVQHGLPFRLTRLLAEPSP